jgi:hypothetical protein
MRQRRRDGDAVNGRGAVVAEARSRDLRQKPASGQDA